MRAQLFAVFLLLTEAAMTPEEDLGQFVITVLRFWMLNNQNETLLNLTVGFLPAMTAKHCGGGAAIIK